MLEVGLKDSNSPVDGMTWETSAIERKEDFNSVKRANPSGLIAVFVV